MGNPKLNAYVAVGLVQEKTAGTRPETRKGTTRTPDFRKSMFIQSRVLNTFWESDFDVHHDPGCVWSDGNVGGFCSELFTSDVYISLLVGLQTRSRRKSGPKTVSVGPQCLFRFF